jgi:hypothetical protein
MVWRVTDLYDLNSCHFLRFQIVRLCVESLRFATEWDVCVGLGSIAPIYKPLKLVLYKVGAVDLAGM